MLIIQKNLFSKEECDIILNLSNDTSQNWNFKDRSYISQTINYTSETEWLFNKLKNFVEIESNIKFLTIKKQIHFHTFKKDDWFGKHNDVRDNRIYAIGVLLNDNFVGGDFKMYNPNEIILDKVIGNAYLFDVRIDHEIMQILDGERYSLLWFLQKENIKIETNKLI
jgi:hypothetical protein